MSIRQWPVEERPVEKILTKSAQSLSNAELVGIILESGSRQRNAVELAQDLLTQFGGLRKLLTANPVELLKMRGLGKQKVALLISILELCKRYLEDEIRYCPPVINGEITKQYLQLHLSNRKSEVFACMFLNARNQLIRYEELFKGGLNTTSIYPRIVLQKALEYNAASVIFAHNHPSGSAVPSEFDKVTTCELVKILAHVDIQVNDHLIIGENELFSFAEAGLLS